MNLQGIDSIIKEMSKYKFVSAIFLFGSQTNGRARGDSDFDIAVLTKNSTPNEEIKLMGFASDKVDVSIFHRMPLIIQFRILRDGKLIFLRNEEKLHDVKYEVFRRYLDYSAFINNFYARKIKNV